MKIKNALFFAFIVVAMLAIFVGMLVLVSLGFQYLGLQEDAAKVVSSLIFVFVGAFMLYLFDDNS